MLAGGLAGGLVSIHVLLPELPIVSQLSFSHGPDAAVRWPVLGLLLAAAGGLTWWLSGRAATAPRGRTSPARLRERA